MGYETDISLERRFAKVIKGILGNYFITQDAELDKKEGTDFAVFTVEPFRIGARLRRSRYYSRYADEFTIRWSRPSGAPTEIDKIRQGLVNYILYGFVDETETRLMQYFLGNLGVFRECARKPVAIFPNNPRDSDLAVFEIAQFPPSFICKWWARDGGARVGAGRPKTDG